MTKIFHMESNNIDEKMINNAADAIKNGQLVVFPTETVYGLGANAFDVEAVSKIYIAKGRPNDNPIIVHINNLSMLKDIVEEVTPLAEKLIAKFWPGPLTLILKKYHGISDKVTGGLDTIAVRMPSNPIALKLIEKANVPIAAPSANISGKPSPTKGEHVIEDLQGRVDIIIASEQSNIGLESTVVDLSDDKPILLRPGAITIHELKDCIGEISIDNGLFKEMEKDKVRSPGMKYKHYSPKAPLTIISGAMGNVTKEINKRTNELQKQGKKVGIIATEETKNMYNGDIVQNLGNREKPQEIMHNLFDVLREFDKNDVDVIISEGFSSEGLELAISNRLVKASGYDILEV